MQDSLNPLTVIEAVAHFNDWTFSKLCDNEAVVVIPTSNFTYEVHFIWQQEAAYLHIISFSDLEIKGKPTADFLHLLMLANQKMWVGSFNVLENNIVAYRHVLHLKEMGYNDLESLIDEVIVIAVEESESYFPGFMQVLQEGNLSSADLNLLSLEVEGCA